MRLTSGALATVIVGGALLLAAGIYLGHAWWWERQFEAVTAGMSKVEVERRLGRPDSESGAAETFFFGCDADPATQCPSWNSGVREFHVVCFDASGRVLCAAAYDLWE